MANADLLRREGEFYASLFDSAKGDVVKSRGQMIERKIEALEDMAWPPRSVTGDPVDGWMIACSLNSSLVSMLKKSKASLLLYHGVMNFPYQHFAGQVLVSGMPSGAWTWMLRHARFMQDMKQSSAKQKNHVDEDELIALSAWRRIDRQTREAIKRNFLPDLLEIYKERVRAFIEDTSDKDVLVLNVQDPFQRLLLRGVCEFYNVTLTTMTTVRDGMLWKTTTIRKRAGTVAPS